MYAEFMGGGTYLLWGTVLLLWRFFGSSVFHFANNLGSRITDEHIQVHWGGGGRGGYRLLLEWVFLRLALN